MTTADALIPVSKVDSGNGGPHIESASVESAITEVHPVAIVVVVGAAVLAARRF